VTPRFAAEAEVARRTAAAATPSRARLFLMRPPVFPVSPCRLTRRHPRAQPASLEKPVLLH
jgi:hypothetical protein